MSLSIAAGQPNRVFTRMQSSLAAAKPAANAEDAREKRTLNAPKGQQVSGESKSGSAWPRRNLDSDGPRVEVDRRTEEGQSVKITVISYSDGSSESVTMMKADEMVSEVTDQLMRSRQQSAESVHEGALLGTKGAMVDRTV